LEALQRHIASQSCADLRAQFQGCAWLVRLLPELADGSIEPLPAWNVPAEQEHRLMVEAVVRFLTNVGGPSGTLLLLDDLQWAGPDALDLLAALTRAAAEVPLRILGAYRDTEVQSQGPLGVLLADLAHAGLAAQRQLGPLAPAEAAALLDELLTDTDADLRERVLSRAGGVPFFLVSYAQGLQSGALLGDTEDAIPWDVAQGLRQRVAALPDVAREVLTVAAVAGRVVSPKLLRTVIVQPEPELLSALDAISRAHLLVETPAEGYRFPHDVIREVVEADLGLARRAALHRQVAEALAQQAGAVPIELVAYHYARSDQQERAIDYLVQAAERAYHTVAYQEYVDLLAEAMRIAERSNQADLVADLRIRRGRAFQNIERYTAAHQNFDRAGMYNDERSELEIYVATLPGEAIERRAHVYVYLAELSFWLGDIPGMRRNADAALPLAELAGNDDLAAEAMSWRAEADKCDGDLPSSLQYFRTALTRPRKPSLPTLVNAPLLLYLIGQSDEAAAVARAGVEAARAANEAGALMMVYPHLGLALAAGGRYGEALQVFEEAGRFGRECDMPSVLARAMGMSIGMHLDLFDYDGAERIAEEARELARSADWLPTIASAGIDLLFNFTWRQEIDRAERLLDEVVEAVEVSVGWHRWLWQLRLAQVQAEIALAHGRWEEAMQLADQVCAYSRRHGRVKYEAAGMRTRALALATGGRVREAIAGLNQALALARSTGDPAHILRVATAVLRIDGEDTLAADARAIAHRVLHELPTGPLRHRFLDAEPLQILGLGRQPTTSDAQALVPGNLSTQAGSPA
jgi:tetratricopeptide (TPR) repeat protein